VKTQSEIWFERFCTVSGLAFERIPEETTRTPDYTLAISENTIIVEVKEIVRNEVERKSDQLLAERGYGEVLGNTPGDRLRKKISDCSSQIKARGRGLSSSILVVADIKFGCGQVTGHLDPYNVRVAMYGLEQVHIAVPRDYSQAPYATGMSFGPKRKMTQEHNTSISAIGVLSTPKPDDIRLDVYHNRFAAVPLNPSLLAQFKIPQFELSGEIEGTTADWVEITPSVL
jgi:hypothetical protein